MRLRYTFCAIACLLLSNIAHANLENLPKEEELTYEYLLKSRYTSHVYAWKTLFDQQRINHFLEFGLGLGTKFFIDNCKQVTSVEVLCKNNTKRCLPWYKDTVALLGAHKNWHPVIYQAPPLMNFYYVQAYRGIFPTADNQKYFEEVNKLCNFALENKRIDAAFVDCGYHPRDRQDVMGYARHDGRARARLELDTGGRCRERP